MNTPIKLQPVFKEIVWGGNRLKTDYGFQSELNNIAEAWMLCARNDGDNVIVNGEHKGESFTEFINNNKTLLGSKGQKYEEFPLLIKFIDAKADLSVQVHPDDEYARVHENSYGKTEAWYILDCDEGAELIYGFNKELTSDEFRKSIEDNTFLNYVNKVKVKKGDVFFISAGTLHAIGSGILLAEVQQNCNTTYRVYDYNRMVNGKPRELHVEKAIDVTDTIPPTRNGDPDGEPVICGDATKQNLCKCEFFKMDTLDVNGTHKLQVNDESFVSLLVLEGIGQLKSDSTELALKAGDSVFVPANCGEVELKGKIKVLLSTL
jgi:mannose-6-phosphate isomerase